MSWPEGTQQSIVELQNQHAAQRSQETGLVRLIWMPPGLQPADSARIKGDRMFDWLLDPFRNEIAIDLGTATTLIYRKGKGIVLTVASGYPPE